MTSRRRQLGLPRGGVVITNMYRTSPAVDAQLRIGDIVTGDRRQAGAQRAATRWRRLPPRNPAASITLHLLRGRSELDSTGQRDRAPELDPGHLTVQFGTRLMRAPSCASFSSMVS